MATRTKEIKQPVIESNFYTCDFCGKESQENNEDESIFCCDMCGKDICEDHLIRICGKRAYPDIYCKECYDKGTEYRTVIEECNILIDKAHQEWVNKCLEKEK
jgi:hypothetical protein